MHHRVTRVYTGISRHRLLILPVLIIVTDIHINLLLIVESANLFDPADLFDTVAVIIINYLNFNHFLMKLYWHKLNLFLALATEDAAQDFTVRPVGAFCNDKNQYKE